MPKSDAWPGEVSVGTPGGIAVGTLGGMDSVGSCDSVASIHSGFSDGSLEQLSAEERECILFLEETIESLEADGGFDPPTDPPSYPPSYPPSNPPSNPPSYPPTDPPSYPPSYPPSNPPSNPPSVEPNCQPAPGSLAQKIAHLSASLSAPMSKHLHHGPKGEVGRPLPGFLVPTPLVMAKSSQPNAELGTGPPPAVSERQLPGKMGSPPGQDATAADRKEGLQGRPKTSSSRGPLSYDGLMELRLKPPLKKHAQSFSSGDRERAKPSPTGQSHRPSDPPSQHALLHQTPEPKAAPPTVAPKPRKLQASFAAASHKELVPNPSCPGTSPRERAVMDPQQVRREALAKLGLLQDGGPVPPPVTRTLSPGATRPRSRSHLHPASSSASHSQPVGANSVTLDRCSDNPNKPRPLSSKPHPLGSKPRPRATSLRERKELETAPAEPTSQKPLFPNGISVAMAPWNQPGQVRQEALRKLGLLRE